MGKDGVEESVSAVFSDERYTSDVTVDWSMCVPRNERELCAISGIGVNENVV